MSASSKPVPNEVVRESSGPPAMGERRARWGYGYQDRVATAQVLDLLRVDLRDGTNHFQGVRLADLQAGRVDDFVLIFDTRVQGNSIKWSGSAGPMNWGELIGTTGLIRELADGYQRLSIAYAGKDVEVQLQTNRPAATAMHPSQLIRDCTVSDFFGRFWRLGPTANESEMVAAIWSAIRVHAGLSEADFAQFVMNCRVKFSVPQPPSAGASTEDQRNYLRQFDSLHKAIATWITKNPDKDFIDSTILLDAIGFAAYRTGLEQRFPAPEIPYRRNLTSAQRIKDAIDSISGGYLALTGPAGVGKSTLVQDALSEYPLFIPYYAFLPDGIGNPRDRGESLTFFQDVVTRLDRFFEGRRSLGISDVAQGRDALRHHMQKAHQLFERDGYKTILLIDGLDHVQRETGLDHPLLFQLPTPAEIPDGFVIILSSQPQALLVGGIERHVAAEVAPASHRRIPIEGLSRDEIHNIVGQANPEISFEDKDALFHACSGNPLILTYLLRFIDQRSNIEIPEAIAAAGSYSGDMDRYYHDALSECLLRDDHRALLGLLSKAVVPVPISWLRDWPEWSTFEQLYQSTLQPFLRIEGRSLHFIHNSLVAFLKSETRSRVPGVDLEQDERRAYSLLADRCDDAECIDPVGRGKVFYLLRSERYQELLDFLSTAWLRRGIEAFVPFAEIRPIVLHGIAAALKLKNYGEVLRFVLTDFELAERSNRISPQDLARELLRLGHPDLAISQIRSAGRILVEDKHALRVAVDFYRYGLDHNDHSLIRQARVVYRQSKPINIIYRIEPLDRPETHQAMEELQEWSEVAPLFESPEAICAQIMKLQIAKPSYDSEPQPEGIQALLIYQSLETALDEGATLSQCLPYIGALARLGVEPLYFAGLLRTCLTFPSRTRLRKLERQQAHLKAFPDLDLQFAEVLLAGGELDKARAICSTLTHIRIDGYRSQRYFGLADISFTIRLRRLQVLLGLDAGSIPQVADEGSEAVGRIEAVARQLGELFAAVQMGQTFSDVRGIFRSLLLFHNRPARFEDYNKRDNYRLVHSRDGIYRRVTDLASLIGLAGIEALRGEVADVLNGPASQQFNFVQRQLFALFFFESHVMERSTAATLGVSDIRGVVADDPVERQEACLDNAVFLKRIGDNAGSDEWFLRAGTVTAGAGSHKDFHMAQLADWLTQSCAGGLDGRRLRVIEKFVRALEVAGGDGAGRATSDVLKFLGGVDAGRALSLATELVDREMLDVEDTLASLMLGALGAGASIELLSAFYCSLLTLVSTGHTSEVASAMVRAVAIGSRSALSRQLMAAVRTNSLPQYRLGVGRALRDILLESGEDATNLCAGLPPDHDDPSMESSLYRLADGSTLTMTEMSQLLGNPSRRDLWNPNPADNQHFDWWKAIAGADVQNGEHAERLLTSFRISDYRDVEVLAWRSKLALKQGDRASARSFADQAVASAQDGSWFTWMDGAKLRVAYTALMEFDGSAALDAARERFGKDLADGKLWNRMLLDDTPEIFRFLKIAWPSDAVLNLIEDYLDSVLAVSRNVPPAQALTTDTPTLNPDAALWRFLIFLLAFPVVDIGVAARRALAAFVKESPNSIRAVVEELVACDSVQPEYLLAAIEAGISFAASGSVNPLQQLLDLNSHSSAGVRAIARRICNDLGWSWQEINDRPFEQSIVLPGAEEPDADNEYLIAPQQFRNVVLQLNRRVIRALCRTGADKEEVVSEILQKYWDIEGDYLWKDDQRLSVWRKMVHARFWLNPRAIIAREAGLRALGIRASSGRAPASTEEAYDVLYPIYDPQLELVDAIERPTEMRALEWSISSNQERKVWLAGTGGDSWSSYPSTVRGLQLIGERTYLIRPDWEWPREERRRGILAHITDPAQVRESLSTFREVTYEMYLEGIGQEDEQIVIANDERQLVGPAYRWIAFNARIARSLGWFPVQACPFEWRSNTGALMVKSVFWRDGWVGLEPPRMESLGEGWYVVASAQAIEAVRLRYPEASLHLWVERHSHGDTPYHQQWHLISLLR